MIPAPVEPGRYGPVRVLFDERYGGFLGYEVEGELYSSLDTLPPRFRGYITAAAAEFCSTPGCVNRPERRGRCRSHRGQR